MNEDRDVTSAEDGYLMTVIGTSSDPHFVFFFQAEDGIRDLTVTGVQTCALPISGWVCMAAASGNTCTKRRNSDTSIRINTVRSLHAVIQILHILHRMHDSNAPPALGDCRYERLGCCWLAPQHGVAPGPLRASGSRGG